MGRTDPLAQEDMVHLREADKPVVADNHSLGGSEQEAAGLSAEGSRLGYTLGKHCILG